MRERTATGSVTRRELVLLASGLALSGAAGVAPPRDRNGLYPDEELLSAGGVESIARRRRGSAARPLLLFFPGGGHLARIGYGHPDANADDFLLPNLERRGFSTIAFSYPSNHPAFSRVHPELGIADWTRACTDLAAQTIADWDLSREIVGIGWSLGGRAARNLAVESDRARLSLIAFVGLSATPPIPGFGGLSPSQVRLTSRGLWDSSSSESFVARARQKQLDVIDALNNRIVVPGDIYRRDYLCDTPLNLRGEAARVRRGELVNDIAAAVADQGSFDFAGYPITAIVTASGQADARHAVTDPSAWSFLNSQALHFRRLAPRLARGPIEAGRWRRIQALIDSLPQRLTRRVADGHVFFVGSHGAAATAHHIDNLLEEISSIERELDVLVQ